ncbi:VacJ family lipoprotein [Burkholderiaceae bacterium DAT-1]|nr:VacJ family lipoprotein [Burkholderiaceae bacterium DAT-1]
MKSSARVLRSISACMLFVLMAGCATPGNYYDPLEPVNRKVYAFNKSVDEAVMQPVARGYRDRVPQPVQTAVSNVLGNFEDIYIGLNNYLQGKVVDGTTDAFRVMVNTTLGLGGLIDIASAAKVPKHQADFGQTLGKWGVGSGPYLVMPFLGPKTLRDTTDWVVGSQVDGSRVIHDQAARNQLKLIKVVDLRARLLNSNALIGEASLGDEYAFVRNGYLQRRYSLIYDGAPPKPLKLGDDDDFDISSIDEPTSAKSETGKSADIQQTAPVTTESPPVTPAEK